MQILIIFSLFLVVEALKSNIFFTFLNKTDFGSSTKILYHLHVQPHASIPFEVTDHFNILMQNSISYHNLKVYGGTFILLHKYNNSVFARRSLLRFFYDENQTIFKFSFNFVATDIIEEVTTCKFRFMKQLSMVSIIDYYMDNRNLTINEQMWPSRLDAHLDIPDKAVNILCITKINFIFIILTFGIFVVIAMFICIDVFKFVFKRTSRVGIEVKRY